MSETVARDFYRIHLQYRYRYLLFLLIRCSLARVSFERKSASINRVLSKDTRVIDDRSIAPQYPRGVLRILPITANVIDIESRGGYRLDTIDSAPGVSPAWTIYNVNIPEPGSTLFSRPFSFLFVLFYFFCIPCLSCAGTTSREGKRPIIPCISNPD